eukprot:symbB.v1.2.013115.t1/scaffold921.1/size152096/11
MSLQLLAFAVLPQLLVSDTEVQLPPPSSLTCSACLWSAKAFRSILVEKMPRRTKAKERRRLAEESFATVDSICAHRFPQQLVRVDAELGRAKHLKIGYYDFADLRGDKASSLTSEHFEMLGTSDAAKEEVHYMCKTLSRAFPSAMVEKVASHKARIYSAITDYWLCVRQANLCTAEDAPPGGDDDEDEDLSGVPAKSSQIATAELWEKLWLIEGPGQCSIF